MEQETLKAQSLLKLQIFLLFLEALTNMLGLSKQQINFVPKFQIPSSIYFKKNIFSQINLIKFEIIFCVVVYKIEPKVLTSI